MTRVHVRATVNDREVEADVEARLLLVHFLREVAGQHGTRVGCDTTSCGACTVLLDGQAVRSCTMFAAQVNGRCVTTVEGLAPGDAPLHPLQEAFHQEHGLQCGFCTPGIIMAAHELVETSPDPSEGEVRQAISGNLCRCTGYASIVRAVRRAAGTLAEQRQGEDGG